MGVCRVDHTEFKEKECESQLLYLHKTKKKMENGKNPKTLFYVSNITIYFPHSFQFVSYMHCVQCCLVLIRGK